MRLKADPKTFGALRTTVIAAATAGLVATGTPQPANAGLLGGALLGGLGGSVVGGILGGRRGSRAGAVIGGIVGAVRGSENADAQRYAAQRKAAYYAPSRTQGAQGSASPSSTLVIETQKALVRLGYDPGPIDGVSGAATRNAVTAYQSANGMTATGQMSDALLKHMLKNGG